MATWKKLVIETTAGNIGQTAATVVTNANLTGVVTSSGSNATSIADSALSIAKTSGLDTALAAKAPLASPTFTGTVSLGLTGQQGILKVHSGSDVSGSANHYSTITQSATTGPWAVTLPNASGQLITSSQVATTYAPLASPTFTGTVNGADLILSGNLTVSGDTTTINVGTLAIEDGMINIAHNVSGVLSNNYGIKIGNQSDSAAARIAHTNVVNSVANAANYNLSGMQWNIHSIYKPEYEVKIASINISVSAPGADDRGNLGTFWMMTDGNLYVKTANDPVGS